MAIGVTGQRRQVPPRSEPDPPLPRDRWLHYVDDWLRSRPGVITPCIFGLSFDDYMDEQPHFVEISENTELVVATGCRSRTARSNTEVGAVTCSND